MILIFPPGETQFSGDFDFPSGGGKRSFRVVLAFPRLGNAVFAVFYLSAVAETHFSLFSIFRPWPKRSFSRFLFFGRGRNAVFAVFYLSAVAEMQFSLFSIFRPWPKRSFCRFLMIPSTESAVFSVF